MSSNISDILKQLDNLNIENGIDVYVPSLKKNVKFKTLNLKQQKELLKSSIDESLTKLAFNTLFFNVIQTNVLESINTSALLTVDRIAIALALRAYGLDSNITIQDKNIDLKKKISDLQAIDINLIPLQAIIEDAGITVNIQAPSLGVDNEVNVFAINKTKNTENEDFKAVIGELFIYELTKFIKSIAIISGETQSEIVLQAVKPADRIAIIEKLPSTATSKILDFIKKYREFETSFASVEGVTIDIDGSFFTV